jgi:hypothetical protein
LKSVFIIAIVAVAMIGVMVPSSFAESIELDLPDFIVEESSEVNPELSPAVIIGGLMFWVFLIVSPFGIGALINKKNNGAFFHKLLNRKQKIAFPLWVVFVIILFIWTH